MNSANRENGEPQSAPMVYHPYGDTTPAAYDEYADPAVAHGWQNAYDDTVRIDVTDAADAPDAPDAADAPDESGPSDRPDRREQLARRRRARLIRRGVVAGCVAGVVLLAVVVAGLFGSESSGVDDRQSPKARQSPSAAAGPGAAGSSADPSGTSTERPEGVSPVASDGASVSPSPGDSRPGKDDGGEAGDESDRSGDSTTEPPTTAAPTTTSEPDRGNSDENPGRGQRPTKDPK
ncbi:hypothetical protein G5C60_14350 [Streptomyces sp. HC44]|uniref:Uncharacterized protein n=1 Tax=Streptomyces scabichelini TaxID=2711217 RepID=A0A6G4V3V4_9ACTN|nr:hypothetical protein [Streptomyces scabichelini]NGO08752.1 hypothetical protein [Streptomyces scabichelini]